MHMIIAFIIPHQTLLQSDWSFTQQHFRCLVLSPFESCHMINISEITKSHPKGDDANVQFSVD